MPLIIVILIIIIAFTSIKPSIQESARKQQDYDLGSRKTNAELEREIFDSFIKKGIDVDKSFELTVKKVAELGFEPCIPREAYEHGNDQHSQTYFYSSKVDNLYNYNSETVRRRIEEYDKFSKKMGHWFTSYITQDQYVYEDFPKNQSEYYNYKYSSAAIDVIELGSYVTFLRTTYEVCGYDLGRRGIPLKHHLKCVKTGNIIHIPLGVKSVYEHKNKAR